GTCINLSFCMANAEPVPRYDIGRSQTSRASALSSALAIACCIVMLMHRLPFELRRIPASSCHPARRAPWFPYTRPAGVCPATTLAYRHAGHACVLLFRAWPACFVLARGSWRLLLASSYVAELLRMINALFGVLP